MPLEFQMLDVTGNDLLQFLNTSNRNAMMEAFGIEFTEASKDRLVLRFTVNHRVHQP
jgi:acyl-coenzyme A thioesterase PaaI-like protein